MTEAKHTPGPYHTGDIINHFWDGSCWRVPVWANNGPEGGKIAGEGIAPTRESTPRFCNPASCT